MFSAKVHRLIYLVLLILLGGCMVTSIWASNLMWVLLLANWVLEGRWAEKWQVARQSRLLHAVVALFVLNVVGLLWTDNLAQGLSAIQLLLPWLFVPLVVLTTRPPVGRVRDTILFLYAGTVVVVSFIGLVRWLTIPDLPYRDLVPYVSHIRFSLNCCMVLFLSASALHRVGGRAVAAKRIGLALLMVWMVAFLLLQRSYTAFAVLTAASLAAILWRRRHWLWLAAWLAAVGGAVAYVAVQYHDYHHLRPMSTQPLPTHTPSGNPYVHHCDGLVENGNYVYNYLCHDELAQHWPSRSSVPLDGCTPTGFKVETTLVRYLNALGLPKDSTGVASLTDEQVAEVVDGVANPVYVHGSLPKHMLYVLFFELENYRCYRAVTGFSMLQRLELWQAALHVVADHPWLGVGTGDLADAMEADFRRTSSPLQGSGFQPHSVFLALMAQFGLPLFVLLMAVWLRAAPRLRRQGSLIAAWAVMVLVSCIAENTLGTLTGILFATWFMAFRQPDANPQSKGDGLG